MKRGDCYRSDMRTKRTAAVKFTPGDEACRKAYNGNGCLVALPRNLGVILAWDWFGRSCTKHQMNKWSMSCVTLIHCLGYGRLCTSCVSGYLLVQMTYWFRFPIFWVNKNPKSWVAEPIKTSSLIDSCDETRQIPTTVLKWIYWPSKDNCALINCCLWVSFSF